MTPTLVAILPLLNLLLGLLLAAWTLTFLARIVLTWYPQVDLSKGFWPLVGWPTEAILGLTRRVVSQAKGDHFAPVDIDNHFADNTQAFAGVAGDHLGPH